MWDVEQLDRHVSQIFQDAKAMQLNIIFNKVKFDLEDQP